MKIKDIQYLIDNKLQPNVAEWTMDVEDVLLEMDMLFVRCSKTVVSSSISANASY